MHGHVNCSELSQLHEQPVDADACPTSIRKLCYKLPRLLYVAHCRSHQQRAAEFQFDSWTWVKRKKFTCCFMVKFQNISLGPAFNILYFMLTID